MKYQLVLQLPEIGTTDFEQLIAIEDRLMDGLGEQAVVDGHDFGAGMMNIFIHTNDPASTFERAFGLLRIDEKDALAAAFREGETTDFVSLWPACSDGFELR